MISKTIKVLTTAFTLAFLLTGCARLQDSPPIPPEEPTETPIESPVETPVEAPLETPVETPAVEDEKEPVITTETVKEEVKIPFTTVKKNDETLEKGKTVVSQKGIDGTETVTYEVTYTDGVETGRKEVGREVTKKVVEEVVKVGVKVVASAPKPAPTPTPTPKPTPAPTAKPVVTTKEEIKKETIAFAVDTKYDNTLEEGKERVERDGVNGTRTIVYTVTLTDGKETGRVVKSDTRVDAINKIIVIGTKKTETFEDKMAKQLPSGFSRGGDGPWPYTGKFVVYKGSTPVAVVSPSVIHASIELSISDLKSLADFWIKYREGSGLTVNRNHVFEAIKKYKETNQFYQIGDISLTHDSITVRIFHQGF
ncbi:G5 domain-containing protein [Proteiniclasticum ruminis]|uniref:G5 domain-containing protein n=1 Tax=Proteiniclasticum ruminis TaxID=398199 RepID=A0A1I5EUB6_9CLOT|nr:G5 domain-containing protein [Proteiniclasticum ruminis]SFO15118.1 G5 domain-containing protein [Proteiniclasticum ruminis]